MAANGERIGGALFLSLSFLLRLSFLSLCVSVFVCACEFVCECVGLNSPQGCGLYLCVLPVEGWLGFAAAGVNHCPCLDIQQGIYGGAAFSFLAAATAAAGVGADVGVDGAASADAPLTPFASFRRQMLDPRRNRVHHHQQ